MRKTIVVVLAGLLCCGCVSLQRVAENNGITQVGKTVAGVAATYGEVQVSIGYTNYNFTTVKDSDTGQGSYEHNVYIGTDPGDMTHETKVKLGQ